MKCNDSAIPSTRWCSRLRASARFTSPGIYQTMQSGIYAADAIADVLQGAAGEAKAWRSYDWRCRKRFTVGFLIGHLFRGLVCTRCSVLSRSLTTMRAFGGWPPGPSARRWRGSQVSSALLSRPRQWPRTPPSRGGARPIDVQPIDVQVSRFPKATVSSCAYVRACECSNCVVAPQKRISALLHIGNRFPVAYQKRIFGAAVSVAIDGIGQAPLVLRLVIAYGGFHARYVSGMCSSRYCLR